MAKLAARLAILLLAFGQLLVIALPVAGRAQSQPQSYDEALARFAGDSFSDTEAGITGVAASGNPLAARIIEALQDGRLLFNADEKKVYVREASGRHIDAATGQAVTGAAPTG